MARGHRRQVGARQHDQRLDAPQAPLDARRVAGEQLVGAPQALEVGLQPLHEQRVEHEAEQLTEGRRPRHGGAERRATGLTHADDQDPFGAEAQGRRQRRELAHGAVAEVVAVHRDGREEERHRGARHQVVQPELGRHAAPAGACPGFEGPRRLHEGHRLPAAEARRRDREGVQLPVLQGLADAREIDAPLEQFAQRPVVEQGSRRAQQQAGGGQRDQQVRSRAQHGRAVRAEHLPDPEVAPDAVEHRRAAAEARGVGREGRREDGAGRRPAQDAERQRRAGRVPAGDGLQHAHLVGGPGPPARQHQGDPRRAGSGRLCWRGQLGNPRRGRMSSSPLAGSVC